MADARVAQEASRQELADVIDRVQNKGLFVLLVCIVGAIVQSVHYGLTASAAALGVGAGISLFALIALGLAIRDDPMLGTRDNTRLETGCTIVTKAFAVYLLFFRGLWGARPLLHHITVAGILVHATLVYCGGVLWLVVGKLSALSHDIDTGKVVVQATDQPPAG
jgi:hypothetical protein